MDSKLKANCGQLFRPGLVSPAPFAVKKRTTGLWTDCPLNSHGHDFRYNSNPNVCGLANATCKTRDLKQVVKSRLNIAIRKLAKPCYKVNSIAPPSDTFFDCLELVSGDGIKRRGREIN